MPQSEGIVEASESVIREIEDELDRVLSIKRNEIEKALAARIRKEQEETRRKLEDVEREFDQEKKSLGEYRVLVAEVESERQGILGDLQEAVKRALEIQSRIEAMARQAIEEIQTIAGLQEKLESLRKKTAEQAGFLRKDLRERFGISSDPPAEPEAPPSPVDLDQELEKLRRIKALLVDRPLHIPAAPPSNGGSETEQPLGLDLDEGWRVRIPEIRELTQSAQPDDESGAERPAEEISVEPGEPAASEALGLLRRTLPADGSSEVVYYQIGNRVSLDAGHLTRAIEAGVEEAEKLALKLDESATVKNQFFVKQGLIYAQEAVRKIVDRAVGLCEIMEPVFPSGIRDVFNLEVLKNMQDKLSIGNWATSGDLESFSEDARELRAAWMERSDSLEQDSRAILDALNGR